MGNEAFGYALLCNAFRDGVGTLVPFDGAEAPAPI